MKDLEIILLWTGESVANWTGLCDGQYGPFSLPPLSFLLLKAICGISEEHHVFFALNLPLQELKPCAVEAQHILGQRGRMSQAGSPTGTTKWLQVKHTYPDLSHFGDCICPQLINDWEEHLVTGDLPKVDSSTEYEE